MRAFAGGSVQVGRDAETGTLRAALEAGREGIPRAVVVKGEAGIGKTRLLTELLADTASLSDGVPILTTVSHCADQGDIGAPFAAVRRTLRDLYGAVGDAAFRAAAGGAPVLRTLAALLPDLDVEPQEGAPTVPVAEAVERVLENLSHHHHLVIVLEDLHWADASTRGLLKALAPTLRGEHLTVVMTVRTDDVDRAHPLRDVITSFERNRSVHVIDVARLDRSAVGELASQLRGRAPTAEQLDVLMTRSEGVPFFVEELLELTEEHLPPTLRDVVLARCGRLSPRAREVVDALAVAGNRVDHDLLECTWNGTELELSAALTEAIDGNIVLTTERGYRFRHALIREALYEQMLPRHRGRWHRAFAECMQHALDKGESESAAVAAEHWIEAGETSLAFSAWVAALADARSNLAPATAARIGERLLEQWDSVADAEDLVGMARLELSAQVARDLARSHHLKECISFIEGVLAQAPAGDRLRAPLLMTYVEAATETGLSPDMKVALDEIDELLSDAEDERSKELLASSRAWHTIFMAGQERLDAALDALETAEATGAPETIGSAYLAVSRAHGLLGDVVAEVEYLRRGSHVAPPFGHAASAIENNLVCGLIMLGEYEDACRVGLEAFARAEAAGLERSAAHVLSNTAEATISAGRYLEGIKQAQRALALVRGDSLQPVLNSVQVEGVALVWSDRLEECRVLLDREEHLGAQVSSDPQWLGVWNVLLIDLAVARARDADPESRLAMLHHACMWAEVLADSRVAEVPSEIDVLLLSAARLTAEIADAGGEPPEVSELIATLTAELQDIGWFTGVKAVVSALLSDAARQEGAVGRWRAAYETVSAGKAPARLVHEVRYRLARALNASREDGADDEAGALLSHVIEHAPDEGAALVARWAREASSPGRPHDAGRDRAGLELTEREREVVALVARGMTNGEIGKTLFISPKTVSVHVSAILAKSGASNRAEAAAIYAAASYD